MGLQGVELVMLGYNTPLHYPPAPEHDHLQDTSTTAVMQAGAYQNGTWVVGVAKAGREEGCDLIGGSLIVAPTGEIVAQAATTRWATNWSTSPCRNGRLCDLASRRCAEIRRRNIFNFALHRPGITCFDPLIGSST
jgi:N-carbamoyl-D-amino-acid hydrolase